MYWKVVYENNDCLLKQDWTTGRDSIYSEYVTFTTWPLQPHANIMIIKYNRRTHLTTTLTFLSFSTSSFHPRSLSGLGKTCLRSNLTALLTLLNLQSSVLFGPKKFSDPAPLQTKSSFDKKRLFISGTQHGSCSGCVWEFLPTSQVRIPRCSPNPILPHNELDVYL